MSEDCDEQDFPMFPPMFALLFVICAVCILLVASACLLVSQAPFLLFYIQYSHMVLVVCACLALSCLVCVFLFSIGLVFGDLLSPCYNDEGILVFFGCWWFLGRVLRHLHILGGLWESVWRLLVFQQFVLCILRLAPLWCGFLRVV